MVKKAKAIREQTGDSRYYAPIEAEEKMSIGKRIESIVARPFKILFQEPMLIAITVYMSVCFSYYYIMFDTNNLLQFVYGCIYLLFEAYPIVFTQGHHMSTGASGLMFLPVFGGGVLGVIAVSIVYLNPYSRS